jgi:arylsulfatase K
VNPADIANGGSRVRAPTDRPPNILLIQTDSQDGRVLGCMGHPAMRRATPNLDALARRGVLFRNAYTNNPICCPARSVMWSGTYTHHCEAWNNYKGLEPDTPTFLTHIDATEYASRVVGRTDHLSGRHTVRARVSAWTRSAAIPRPTYRVPAPEIVEDGAERFSDTDWGRVDEAVAALETFAARPDRPFFLYLGTGAPHPPFTISRRYLDLIDEAGVTVPPLDETEHPVMEHRHVEMNWRHGLSDDRIRQVRHIYFAMCAEVDAMMGPVLATLDRLGLADSTCVIFTSDHGEMAMEHRQWYKMSAFEPSSHIPMILAGPGLPQGTVVDTPVSLVDIYATLMDLAGIDRPAGLDGHSLLPLARGEPSDHPGWALMEYHDTTAITGIFMLRRGDWKYVLHVGRRPQLFHLGDDPWEVHDLAESRPDVVAEMDALLRSIVDPEEVDARAKAYDRASFRRWRAEQKAAGTYEETMARIFSGFDRLPDEEVRPWTASDEARIEAWLAEDEG